MLVIDRGRIVVRVMVVLGRRAGLPVVPRPLGINRVHAAELFDAFAMGILPFCHTLQHTKRQRGTVTVTDSVATCPAASTAVIVIV